METAAVLGFLPRNHAAKINTAISFVCCQHRFRYLSDGKLTWNIKMPPY